MSVSNAPRIFAVEGAEAILAKCLKEHLSASSDIKPYVALGFLVGTIAKLEKELEELRERQKDT